MTVSEARVTPLTSARSHRTQPHLSWGPLFFPHRFLGNRYGITLPSDTLPPAPKVNHLQSVKRIWEKMQDVLNSPSQLLARPHPHSCHLAPFISFDFQVC